MNNKQVAIVAGSITAAFIAIVVSLNVLIDRMPVKEPVQAPQVAQPAPVETHPVVAELLADVNNERVKAGLPALVEDPRLDASAAAKCSDEVKYNYFSHVSPGDGQHSWHYMSDQGLYSQYLGENLAYGFTTSQSVVKGWMNSPGHRANVLNTTYTHVGYAICQPLAYPNLVVQHFADESL